MYLLSNLSFFIVCVTNVLLECEIGLQNTPSGYCESTELGCVPSKNNGELCFDATYDSAFECASTHCREKENTLGN